MNNPKTELDTLLDQLDAELGALMEGFHRLDESEASREKYLALMALCEAKADEMHHARMRFKS